MHIEVLGHGSVSAASMARLAIPGQTVIGVDVPADGVAGPVMMEPGQ